jgi:hypothetical protein
MRPNDEAFNERIARALRTRERFDDGFEDRLIATLRADHEIEARFRPAARRRGPWWREPVTFRVSPIAGLAAAASIAAIVILGAIAFARPTPVATVAQGVRDTVHVVRFVFVDGRAKSVALVGDFNAWGAKERTPLAVSGPNGRWSATVVMPPGRHEYAFIVDGKRWTADPFAPPRSDEFDTSSSVIVVGD